MSFFQSLGGRDRARFRSRRSLLRDVGTLWDSCGHLNVLFFLTLREVSRMVISIAASFR